MTTHKVPKNRLLLDSGGRLPHEACKYLITDLCHNTIYKLVDNLYLLSK